MTPTILKPNCHPDILIDTALRNSETFTEKGIVIKWTEMMTSKIESRLIPNTTHTNLIDVTQPFRYDNEEMNDYIYSKNLQLIKTIHFEELNINILECNNILRKYNYNRNGYTIMARGKWYVCRAIWKSYQQQELTTNTTRNKISIGLIWITIHTMNTSR
ncbi:hypothetical protein JTB14_023926 [Gonioctena quinquepunctata]|nr:hypothetical protein JTB14_023926 [Gonioctena quinquepunctata]